MTTKKPASKKEAKKKTVAKKKAPVKKTVAKKKAPVKKTVAKKKAPAKKPALKTVPASGGFVVTAERRNLFPKKAHYITDIHQAREAILRVQLKGNEDHSQEVMTAVLAAFPEYNWGAFWDASRKKASHEVPTYKALIG